MPITSNCIRQLTQPITTLPLATVFSYRPDVGYGFLNTGDGTLYFNTYGYFAVTEINGVIVFGSRPRDFDPHGIRTGDKVRYVVTKSDAEDRPKAMWTRETDVQELLFKVVQRRLLKVTGKYVRNGIEYTVDVWKGYHNLEYALALQSVCRERPEQLTIEYSVLNEETGQWDRITASDFMAILDG